MFENNEKATVEEVYQVAGNASDLTVEADRKGAGDVMIAAGWSESRVGMALLRLHSEWDSRSQVKGSHLTRSALMLLANNLKSRPAVWQQLAPWAAKKGIHTDTVAASLLHWLAPACPVCDGHGLLKIKDAPALSARQCRKCQGTGQRTAPHGSGSVLGYMDDCVSKARQSLKNRLHNR